MPVTVTEATAQRVAEFLHRFLLAHAIAFYSGVLGLSDDHDRLTAIAGYICVFRDDPATRTDNIRPPAHSGVIRPVIPI